MTKVTATLTTHPVDEIDARTFGGGFFSETPQNAVSLGDVWAAAWRQETTFGSWLAGEDEDDFSQERPEDYDFVATLTEEQRSKYAPIYPELERAAYNDQQRDRLLRRYDQELKDREAMARRPLAAIISTLGVTLADPVMWPLLLVPLAAQTRLARAGLAAGLAAAETGVQEAFLHRTQVGRTWDETLWNIGGATAFGGILGGALGPGKKLYKQYADEANRTVKAISHEGGRDPLPKLTDEDLDAPLPGDGEGPRKLEDPPAGDAGAARVDSEATLESEGAKLFGPRFAPVARLLNSPVVAARQYANRMLGHNWFTGRNKRLRRDANGQVMRDAKGRKMYEHDGNDNALYYQIARQQEGMTARMAHRTDAEFKALRDRGVKMKRKDFNEQVGVALSSGDAHEIPEVANAAKAVREEVFKPIEDAYKELGLLPEEFDVKYAASFMPRRYDIEYLQTGEGRNEWNRVVGEHFIQAEIAARKQQYVRDRVGVAVARAEEEGTTLGRTMAAEAIERETREQFEAQFPIDADSGVRTVADTPRLRAAESRVDEAKARAADLEEQTGAARADLKEAKAVLGVAQDELKSINRRRNLSWLKKEKGFYDTPTGRAFEAVENAKQKLDETRHEARLRKNAARRKDAKAADRKKAKTGRAMVTTAKARLAKAEETAQTKLEKLAERRKLEAERAVDKAKAEVERLQKRFDTLNERKLKAWEASTKAVDNLAKVMDEGADAAQVKAARARAATLERRVKTALRTGLERRTSQIQQNLIDTAREEAERATRSQVDRGDFFDPDDIKDIQSRARQRAEDALQNIIEGDSRAAKLEDKPVDLIRERVLQIDDLDLTPFRITDFEYVTQHFIRTHQARLNMLREHGTLDVEVHKLPIREEYRRLRERAEAAGDMKTAGSLNRHEKRDLDLVQDTHDLILGRFGDPTTKAANAARTLRHYTFMAGLGGMVQSAITDVAYVLARQGFRQTAKAMLPTLMMWATKAARQEQGHVLTEMGIAADTVTHSRVHAIGMLDDMGMYSRTGFGRATRVLSGKFAQLTLMNHWNTGFKSMTAIAAQNRIGKALLGDPGKLKTRERTELARFGIGDKQIDRMREMWQAHGTRFTGSRMANTAAWEDREMAKLFEDLLFREVNTTIVTPGVGDRPIFMNTQWGATLMQFKAFAFASWQMHTLRSIQDLGHRPARVVGAMGMALAFGWLAEVSKLLTAGRLGELKHYNEKDRLFAMLDRSGIVALPMELFNIMNKMQGGEITKEMGLEMKGLRYYDRDAFGAALGPGVGFAENVVRGVQGVTNDDFTQQDLHRLRRLVPFQNLFYLRLVIDWLENQIGEWADLRDTATRRNSQRDFK